MESPSVRLARREDAAAIAHIYNQGIEDRMEGAVAGLPGERSQPAALPVARLP